MKWLFLLLLVGCSATIVCDSPYIRHEESCCLDMDNNSICDRDEVVEPVVENTTPELPKLPAEQFKDALATDNASYLYSLLPEEKKVIDEETFVERYPYIQHGMYRSFTNDGELVGEGVRKPDWTKIFVQQTKEDAVVLGFVNKTGGTTNYQTYGFFYDDKWYIQGFERLLYASCDETAQCGGEELQKACEQTCTDRNHFAPLRENDSFACREKVCHCLCSHPAVKGADFVAPDFS